MTALFIAWGALILAVIGCAILDPRPSLIQKPYDQADDDTLVASLA
jgi:hypothetical protein